MLKRGEGQRSKGELESCSPTRVYTLALYSENSAACCRPSQISEDFALPAATASFSLRFTVPLLAAEHFRLLALRCGTACHRRLRRHHL